MAWMSRFWPRYLTHDHRVNEHEYNQVREVKKETRRIEFHMQNLSSVLGLDRNEDHVSQMEGHADLGLSIGKQSRFQIVVKLVQHCDIFKDVWQTFLHVHGALISSKAGAGSIIGFFTAKIHYANGSVFVYTTNSHVFNFSNMRGEQVGHIFDITSNSHLVAGLEKLKKGGPTVMVTVKLTVCGDESLNSGCRWLGPKSFKQLFSGLRPRRRKYGGADWLANLLETGEYSDVVLQVQEEAFTCHKCILAAKSPVFAALFRADMLEANTGVINISDTDPKSMSIVLDYIYTGKYPVLEKIRPRLRSLFYIADKYDLPELSGHMDSLVASKVVRDNNASELLGLARLFSLPKIRGRAMHYVGMGSKGSFWRRKVLPRILPVQA